MTNEKKAMIIAQGVLPFMDGAMAAAAMQFILQAIIKPRKSTLRAGIYLASTVLTMIGQEKLVDEFGVAYEIYDNIEERLLEFFEKHSKKTE